MDADTAPQEWGEPRTRTITWWDPHVTAGAGRELSGIDAMRAVVEGLVPPAPIAQTLGFTIDVAEEGRVQFSGKPDSSVYNPIGMVHGGYACTLLDSVLGCAVHTTLPQGFAYTSIEIKVSYLRAITADSGRILATGWVTKPGRRVAFADGDLRDDKGRVLATASSSCLIMPIGE